MLEFTTAIFDMSQVSYFLERFDDIPDMLELDHLTVSGDVTFGKGVVLKVSIDFYFLSDVNN